MGCRSTKALNAGDRVELTCTLLSGEQIVLTLGLGARGNDAREELVRVLGVYPAKDIQLLREDGAAIEDETPLDGLGHASVIIKVAEVKPILEILGMNSPRSAQLVPQVWSTTNNPPNVLAVLVNPTRWHERPNHLRGTIELDTPRENRFLLWLTCDYKALAFSATKRQPGPEDDRRDRVDVVIGNESSDSHGFSGELVANDTTEYLLYDRNENAAGRASNRLRRELGVLRYTGKSLEVFIPRVRRDGSCAQFRPQTPSDSMSNALSSRRVRDHVSVLKGEWCENDLQLNLYAEEVKVFWLTQTALGIDIEFCHPLSCYQAYAVALSFLMWRKAW